MPTERTKLALNQGAWYKNNQSYMRTHPTALGTNRLSSVVIGDVVGNEVPLSALFFMTDDHIRHQLKAVLEVEHRRY